MKKKHLKKELKRKLGKQVRNLGLNWWRELADRKQEDYLLGGSGRQCIADVPVDEREICLPAGELQFGREDFMSCASISPLNILATKFNWLLSQHKLPEALVAWLSDKGYFTETGIDFSDRFISIKSHTSRTGNSLISPLQAIHEHGLIPKDMLPASSDMTWDDYHNASDITPEMEALGKEFLTKFNINYERVDEAQFGTDMINAAGYAWPQPINGVYPRVDSQPNHAFMRIRPNHFIFDNYFDEGRQGDWIKQLAPDYDFMNTGYKLIITLNEEKPESKMSWIDLIKRFFGGRNML